jgi:hypothetical protein
VETWTGPANAVLAVGGCTGLLFAAFLPETRPGTFVLGGVLLAAALLVDLLGRRNRRRTGGTRGRRLV